MVHSQSAHGAREKRPVVLELGQLEGRLQSPRLTGAGEPTVGRARALSTQHEIYLHSYTRNDAFRQNLKKENHFSIIYKF